MDRPKTAKKKWGFLPFVGGTKKTQSEKQVKTESARSSSKITRQRTPSQVDAGLSREKTRVQAFAAKKAEDIVKDYNSPVHFWIITTLFPLVAGTFGPMASMFNICAIATPWRLILDPKSHEAQGKFIPDPEWLFAINIMSLLSAILANVSLLGQMTNRLRYNISGPITILGFFISGLVDIGLVVAAYRHLTLALSPHATYAQAFYYAAIAGAIYILLAFLLSVTAFGIWFKQYSTEYKLSPSQRSLMLQTILFLVFILITAAVYGNVEEWHLLDSVYFVVVTILTIGFGDFEPKTHLGRSLLFPFAVGGILFVGVIIANIRDLVLETGSIKVSTRMIEKARYQCIKAGNAEKGYVKLRGFQRRNMHAATELERREKEFNIMREIQTQAANNNRIFALLFSTLAFVLLWFVGAVAFWKAESDTMGGEKWSYFDSLYFTFVAQLTIGYGDYYPQTNSAKPAFVLWALIALPTLTVLIGAVGDSVNVFVNWYTKWLDLHTENIWRVCKSVFARSNRASKVKNATVNAVKGRTFGHWAFTEEENRNDSGDSDTDHGFRNIAEIEQARTVPLEFRVDDLTALQAATAEQSYKPFMILKAAEHIIGHLDADPPKRYTFQEWTWLLKLLGEDEADAKGHRRVGIPLDEGHQIVAPVRSEEHHVWSWLGQESPLMSLEDDSEPKWVLKRLMWALQSELKLRAERHIEQHIGREFVPPSSGSTQTGGPSTIEALDLADDKKRKESVPLPLPGSFPDIETPMSQLATPLPSFPGFPGPKFTDPF